MEIAVAVIARPRSQTLDASLAALRATGASSNVYEVQSDGAGMARNRALAASAAQILALVEDDVVVTPSWLTALAEAWCAAPEDVAVIGGPLRARFQQGRPGWLGADFDGAFATVDLGADASDVDLARRTFHGGNVSFRTAALRGASGFWPARGHREGRDWFSDEHHAQHALARCGWRGRYEPLMAGERLIEADQATLTALARRRLRYGARLATAGGGRPADSAARSLSAGLAGAVLAREAAVRRARLLRVAENAGVLVGSRLARADFEPTTTSTPFRPSVPPPLPRRRDRRRRGALVLLYHRVAHTEHDPLGLSVTPQHFAEQVDVLASDHRVVELARLAEEREPGTIAITFDDGYADNATTAAPLLAAAGLPWTLFVSTGHVEEGTAFWWDEVVEILSAAPPGSPAELRLALPGGSRAWRVQSAPQRAAARESLLAALQGLDPGAIGNALDDLRTWSDRSPRAGSTMSVGEVRELAHAGVALGAHTRTHRALAHASMAEQCQEITGSREDVTAWLGIAPAAFSYPFGVPGADLDAMTVRLARKAGYSMAVVNAVGLVGPKTDPFALPRWAVPSLDAQAFAMELRRLLGS